jgi:hypothetical protein
MYGIATRKILKAFNVAEAQVRKDEDKFRIERTLLTVSDDLAVLLIRVKETVGRTGSYEWKVLSSRSVGPPWVFPLPL